jgi:peptide/nickel transport system permease protein
LTGYIIRRLILFVPTLLLVSIIVFTLVQLAPGDAADIMAEDSGPEVREALREKYGFNDPIPVQYFRWISQLATGDFGESLFTGRSVGQDLGYRIPTSLQLGMMAMAIHTVLGISIGVISALKPERAVDQIARTLTILAVSIPVFWTATLLLVIPSAQFGYHPPAYYTPPEENLLENLRFTLPLAAILSLGGLGRLGRLMRTTMLDVLHQDYIRTARAKGQYEWIILTRHAARNALIPVVTVLGLEVPGLFAGSLVVEVIWNVPGMGSFLFGSIQRRDIVVIMNLNMIIATIVLTTNLLVDLMYGVLDPRIRLSK